MWRCHKSIQERMEESCNDCIQRLSKEELLELKKGLEARFEEIKAKGLSLDMSRGKPAADQLNLSMGMMDVLNSSEELTCANGVDCRNYGGLDGIDEAKQLLADMMEVPKDNVIILVIQV